ncbi:MAG: inositol monophosphatase family protein [Candidatus Omnitrophota bacterium]|nr:inositol monophosphatase family protein [Candidatus Omnitrophota bacterium]
MDDVCCFLSVAKSVACKAGNFLVEGVKENHCIDSQEHHDVKLRADKMSETLILEGLREGGGLPVLSEEAGLVGGDRSGFHWIVDPLDGTINYSRGIPLCCVSIGLWDGDAPVCGVVYDPYRQEMFSGISAKGAWLNGHAVVVSNVVSKNQGILVSGFPARADLSEESLRGFIAAVRSYRKLRWLGSAALSLVYVACGRADVYEEKNIMLWDIAGAAPILLGAGGSFRLDKTKKEFCLNVSASNGLIKF